MEAAADDVEADAAVLEAAAEAAGADAAVLEAAVLAELPDAQATSEATMTIASASAKNFFILNAPFSQLHYYYVHAHVENELN